MRQGCPQKKRLPQAADGTVEDKRGECHKVTPTEKCGSLTHTTNALSGTVTLAAATTCVVAKQVVDAGILWITNR